MLQPTPLRPPLTHTVRPAAVLSARHQAGRGGAPGRPGQGLGPHTGGRAAGQENLTGAVVISASLFRARTDSPNVGVAARPPGFLISAPRHGQPVHLCLTVCVMATCRCSCRPGVCGREVAGATHLRAGRRGIWNCLQQHPAAQVPAGQSEAMGRAEPGAAALTELSLFEIM